MMFGRTRKPHLNANHPSQPAPVDVLDVLVVDDSTEAADTLAMALSLDGYRVQTCHSGKDALAAIERDFPLCMLMDFGLPDKDGLEIVREVRAKHGNSIVLVMCTGWEIDEPRVAQAAELVDHYFTKPVSLEKLRQILPPLNQPGGAA
jgi:DNA-binding response OmpR family regulator